VASFVGSLIENIKRHFAPRVGRRALSAFPTFFQRLWRTVPSYFAFYVFVPVLGYGLWYGVQIANVIAPFHLPPEDTKKPLPFSGETVAHAVQDAINSIRAEAAGHPLAPPCEFLGSPEEGQFGGLKAGASGSFEVRGQVSVEVKGFSPEAVKSVARQVLGNERDVTGDVILTDPDNFQLMAREKNYGPWMTKPKPRTVEGLKYASCELAERMIGAVNKNVLAAAWIRRGKFDDVLGLYHNMPTWHGDPGGLNNFGVALRMKCNTPRQVATSLQICRDQNVETIFRNAIRVKWWWFPEGYYNLGTALRDKRQTDAAIAEYRKAIRLKPDYVMAHYGLGVALYDKKKDDAAIAEFRKAIQLEPLLTDAYVGLGNVYLQQREIAKATAEYQVAINIDPKGESAHIGLGNVYLQQREIAKATAEYQVAINNNPSRPWCKSGYVRKNLRGIHRHYS